MLQVCLYVEIFCRIAMCVLISRGQYNKVYGWLVGMCYKCRCVGYLVYLVLWRVPMCVKIYRVVSMGIWSVD